MARVRSKIVYADGTDRVEADMRTAPSDCHVDGVVDASPGGTEGDLHLQGAARGPAADDPN